MQFCDLPTISCLMRTCSTLYGCGSTPLLHQEFFLDSQDAVISFCLFMGAGDGTRYSALRSLSLDLESKVVPIHLGRQIQCLLNHLTALEELIIYGLDDLLDVHPPLVDSIAALATVKDIYLWGCRHRALKDLIPQLHSPLAHISIGFRPKDRFTFLESLSDRELLDYHPVRMFSRFTATLERLDTDYGASALDNRIESPAVYPLVRSLSLCDGWPTMRPWIDAFPALRRLVNLSREGKRRIDGRRTRRMNMNDQLSNGSWAALEKCSGTAFGLYVLGLICPVERLAVKGVSTNEHTQMFFDVLAIARPAYLSIEVKDKKLLQDAAKEGISFTFRRRSARFMFIRTLKLKFHAEIEDRVRTSFDILSLMVRPFYARPLYQH